MLNEVDRGKNRLAIAFIVGDCFAIGGVFHCGGLHKLLDP